MSPHKIFIVCLAVTLALNAIVSIAVAFSGYFSLRQKTAQVLVVWLVPFLGSVMIGLFLVAQGPLPRVRTNTVGATDIDSNAINLAAAISREI